MPTNNLPEIPQMSADRLTSQLYHLPAIIGRLGLSVANAQSALNADYTENVKELISIVKEIIPKTKPEARTEMESLIKQLAPSRYQFTETTLDFSADLSEAVDVAGSIGLGAGFGAVVINAGVSGDTTASARQRLERDVLFKAPDAVLITLGGNDLKNGVAKDHAFENLRIIVNSIQNTGAGVIIGGIKFPIRDRGFGSAYRKLAEDTGAILIPNIFEGIMGNRKLLSDPIHPNDAGYKLIAERFYEAMLQL